MWRRWNEGATLDDVVELLAGIGAQLMALSATLERIEEHLRGEDDGEAES